jgi:hypothetical protein
VNRYPYGVIVFGAILVSLSSCSREERLTSAVFNADAFRLLSLGVPYEYHKVSKEGPVHSLRRDPNARVKSDEMEIAAEGWRLLVPSQAGPVLHHAAEDFRNYLEAAMKVRVEMEFVHSLDGWPELERAIVVGAAPVLPGCSVALMAEPDGLLCIEALPRLAAHFGRSVIVWMAARPQPIRLLSSSAPGAA